MRVITGNRARCRSDSGLRLGGHWQAGRTAHCRHGAGGRQSAAIICQRRRPLGTVAAARGCKRVLGSRGCQRRSSKSRLELAPGSDSDESGRPAPRAGLQVELEVAAAGILFFGWRAVRTGPMADQAQAGTAASVSSGHSFEISHYRAKCVQVGARAIPTAGQQTQRASTIHIPSS
jgi:hypothetical protein